MTASIPPGRSAIESEPRNVVPADGRLHRPDQVQGLRASAQELRRLLPPDERWMLAAYGE